MNQTFDGFTAINMQLPQGILLGIPILFTIFISVEANPLYHQEFPYTNYFRFQAVVFCTRNPDSFL